MKLITSSIFLVLILISIDSLGQGMRKKYADKAYNNLNYYYASEGYEDVLDRNGDSSAVVPEIAESYLKVGNTQKAIDWYAYMNRSGSLSVEEQLNLALLYRKVGDYKSSRNLLSSISATGENTVALSYINTPKEIEELLVSSENFKVEKSGLSTSSSDFNVSYGAGDDLFVTSSNRDILPLERRNGWTGDYFYNIYITDELVAASFSELKGDVDSKYNDAYVAYDSINKLVYFTRNNLTVKAKKNDSKLVLCRGSFENGKIEDVELLSFNDKSYSCSHPTISSDGKTLYFSSDMPGGFGGMDLYRVEIKEDGSFEAPVNLGEKINTPLDEVTPHIKDKDKVLFFSSKGHFGLGGLDVFVAKLSDKGDVESIDNLGVPINSAKDDFSFVNDKHQKTGYLASNREEGDDIFEFTQQTKITSGLLVNGLVSDLRTSNGLAGVKIVVKDAEGNVLKETKTDNNGDFKLDLDDYEGIYSLEVSKDTYVTRLYEFNSDDEQHEKINLSPLSEYSFTGTIRDSETEEGLPSSTIYIIDPETNDTILNTTSKQDGSLQTDYIDKEYNGSFEYQVTIEKEGYITERTVVRGTLGNENALDLNEYLEVELTKVGAGKKDLGIIADIEPIYFDFNSYFIREDAAKELDKIFSVLTENPTINIELRSHTDIRGKKSYNKWLSERRAKSSKDYLIKKGISSSRLRSKGMGEDKPKVTEKEINTAKTDEEKEKLHQLNRRTEFIVVK